MSSKGQFEINETILVIIVFIVLLLFGLIAYNRYSTYSIKNEILVFERNRFESLLNTIPNMPEVRCSIQNKESNCVDTLRLFGFSKESEKYFDRFGYRRVMIKVEYPELKNETCSIERFQLTDYPNCNKWIVYDKRPKKYENMEKLSVPVSLYYPIENRYRIGVLMLEWYY